MREATHAFSDHMKQYGWFAYNMEIELQLFV